MVASTRLCNRCVSLTSSSLSIADDDFDETRGATRATESVGIMQLPSGQVLQDIRVTVPMANGTVVRISCSCRALRWKIVDVEIPREALEPEGHNQWP